MPDWQDMMPHIKKGGANPLAHIEHEALRRILTKSGAGNGAAASFVALAEQLNFPYLLVAWRVSQNVAGQLDIAMLRQPTQSPLLVAFDDAVERLAADHNTVSADVGLVFKWHGYGGFYVLTCDAVLPQQVGQHGRFWRVQNTYYLLEPLDSLIERVGPASDW